MNLLNFDVSPQTGRATYFEDDVVTLDAWLRDSNSRAIILNPNARAIGFAWVQEENLKIWWVQTVGGLPG